MTEQGSSTIRATYDYGVNPIDLFADVVTTTYAYDWAGNRVSQTGTTTTYLYPFKFYSVASSTGSGAKYATTADYVFNGESLVATIDQQTARVCVGRWRSRPAGRFQHAPSLCLAL
jgi:hypothetical protein